MNSKRMTRSLRITGLLVLGVLLMGPAGAGDDKMIYGEDDRLDMYQVNDPQIRKWANATCALIDDYRLYEDTQTGTYQLFTSPYWWQSGSGTVLEACPEEPFGDQVTAPFCSGFLVGPNLVATAGHCITSQLDLDNTYFVFGFEMESETRVVTEFSAAEVYRGVAVIDYGLDSSGLDHALILLDRNVTDNLPGVVPFETRLEGTIPDGQEVGVLGFPMGLPLKAVFSDTTIVRENDHPIYFTSNIDGVWGNSGSPVINTDTGMAEGILVRGPVVNFVDQGNCFVSVQVPDIASQYVENSRTTIFADTMQTYRSPDLALGFRATPAVEAPQDRNVVVLTWNPPVTEAVDEDGDGEIDTPALPGYRNLRLVRTVGAFAPSSDVGTLLFEDASPNDVDNLPYYFVDRNVSTGVEYYYTLFVEPVVLWYDDATAHATAVVSGEPIVVLAEALGHAGTEAIDLDVAFTQITFSPTTGVASESAGAHGGYDVTTVTAVQELPVSRDDSPGNAYQIALTDDGGVSYNLGSLSDYMGREFPFYGKSYDSMYISANGHIVFDAMAPLDPLNFPFTTGSAFPSLANHFAVPRISFLFGDLNPAAGGEIWIKPMEDRTVITFENVPEYQPAPYYTGGEIEGAQASNTVQVELFFSGHIRFTYEEVKLPNAVVGLSDGLGVPVRPSDISTLLSDAMENIDFSQAPALPSRLSFEPIAPQHVFAGEVARFDVATRLPDGAAGQPVLTASWNRAGLAPFSDNGDGTGTFSWETTADDLSSESEPAVLLRVRAQLGGMAAVQIVPIVITPAIFYPEAQNLRIYTDAETPGNAGDDYTASTDRVAPTTTRLTADYDYYHNLGWLEASTELYWLRDGQLMPGLTGKAVVPPAATKGGQQWNFVVRPASFIPEYFGLWSILGYPVVSPLITIEGNPRIHSVTPDMGRVEGYEPVHIIGRQLDDILGVYFNNVRVNAYYRLPATVIDGQQYQVLEVITPLHQAMTVDIRIETIQGSIVIDDAFTYVDDDTELVLADVNSDGAVNAADIQLVLNGVLEAGKAASNVNPDVNRDDAVNSIDVQLVVNAALGR